MVIISDQTSKHFVHICACIQGWARATAHGTDHWQFIEKPLQLLQLFIKV